MFTNPIWWPARFECRVRTYSLSSMRTLLHCLGYNFKSRHGAFDTAERDDMLLVGVHVLKLLGV